ncbi:hypothetical protein HY3_09265 [Hyphomonas pacifica]|uniref:Uncharacterized protein n=1 Tax=Hyphomonas pacifica TaxID=1280941 RepID=A0A062U6F1_9PROT|nr:hypothetical protein HY2_09135 [Hyphomonas pacifica]RAN35023.1 hypothetical protein HY3_09265 [Hyphomonas pacifica]
MSLLRSFKPLGAFHISGNSLPKCDAGDQRENDRFLQTADTSGRLAYPLFP